MFMCIKQWVLVIRRLWWVNLFGTFCMVYMKLKFAVTKTLSMIEMLIKGSIGRTNNGGVKKEKKTLNHSG